MNTPSLYSKICVGTAQFGSLYGITNQECISDSELNLMLDKLYANNIHHYDTASSYGNAQQRLAKFIALHPNTRVISKININTASKLEDLNLELKAILSNLGVHKLDGLLLHDHNVLKTQASSFVYDWLLSLREAGIVNKIGLSVYSPDDLDHIQLSIFDIVQLPISVYNQSFLVGNTLRMLKDLNITVYARSIFLQGLLLVPPSTWDIKLHNKQNFASHHERFLDFINSKSISAVEASLEFVLSLQQIDYLILGFANCYQVNEICRAIKKLSKNISKSRIIFSEWAWPNSNDYDPRYW